MKNRLLRRFGASALRRFGASALRRFGASALRRFGASALRRFGASALRRFGAFRTHEPRTGRLAKSAIRFLLIAGLIGLLPSVGRSQLTFTTIVDGNNAIPNGTDLFTGGFTTPAISGGIVAFSGGNSGGSQWGVYTGSGGALTTIANWGTAIPNGTAYFNNFSGQPFTNSIVSISGGAVAFYGEDTSTAQYGVYTGSGGALTTIVNWGSSIPNGTGQFSNSFGGISISGGSVAFYQSNSNSPNGYSPGIYNSTSGGGLSTIANTNTSVPNGAGTFSGFGPNVSFSGGVVAFVGYGPSGSGQFGIYTNSGGPSFTTIVNQGTAVPNGTGNFYGIVGNLIASSGFTVAFLGSSSGGQGIYVGSGGALTTIATTSTAIPGGTGNFGSFSNVAISSEVAFLGNGSGGQGIYAANLNGTDLTKVIAVGDSLDGSTVSSLSFGNFGLYGNEIAFQATLANGNSGIYMVTFTPTPEPHHILLIGVAALCLLQGVRRLRTRWACGS